VAVVFVVFNMFTTTSNSSKIFHDHNNSCQPHQQKTQLPVGGSLLKRNKVSPFMP
jgi:hypothetical protein